MAPRILDLSIGWIWAVRFTSWPFHPHGRNTGTHWIGGSMGPRAGLDTVFKWKIPSFSPDSKTEHPTFQPIISRYSDWPVYGSELMTLELTVRWAEIQPAESNVHNIFLLKISCQHVGRIFHHTSKRETALIKILCSLITFQHYNSHTTVYNNSQLSRKTKQQLRNFCSLFSKNTING
jgi:hypothetical protein